MDVTKRVYKNQRNQQVIQEKMVKPDKEKDELLMKDIKEGRFHNTALANKKHYDEIKATL